MATVDRIGLNGNDIVRESLVGMGKLGFSLATLTSNDVYQVCVIPPKSVVKSVNIVITTAFNGTTPVFDVGDSALATTFATNVDATAAGLTESATAGKYYANGTVISVTPTFTNTTAGEMFVYVEYLTDISTGTYATVQ